MFRYIMFPVFILSLHWISIRFYSNYCVPEHLYGYLMSYLTMASPSCTYILHIIEKTSAIYQSSWHIFSLWAASILIALYKNITHQDNTNT